jgi:hypothetical protein
MKRLLIILLLVLSILTIGCSSQVIADTTITPETITVTSIVEVENTEKIEELERKLEEAEEENQKYDYLLRNLNSLLKNVGYITGSNNSYKNEGTAFTIGYKGKFYLISAGHLIENEYGKFGNFKYKSNFSDKWIYPELLTYENEYQHRIDYAVFVSDKINSMLNVDTENDVSLYQLNSLTISGYPIKNMGDEVISGESGSPLIDYEGEITGVMIVEFNDFFTEIEIVLKAIDELR